MINEKLKPLDLIIFGNSGAAREAVTLILRLNKHTSNGDQYEFSEYNSFNILGLVTENMRSEKTDKITGLKILTSDNKFESYIKKSGLKEVGIVLPFGLPKVRKKVYQFIKTVSKSVKTKFIFPNLIDPSVIINKDFGKIGEGNLIQLNTSIVSYFNIGNFNYISAESTLGHDIDIKNFSTVFPNVTVAGNCVVEDGSVLGSSSTVLPGVTITKDSVIGASSLVTKNTEKGLTYVGIPAKILKK